MLGNIGSPYQKICPKIIKILSKKPPKLKVLILNRIYRIYLGIDL